MIIDVHNHADWHGHNLQRTLENMDKYNIDMSWLLSWEAPRDEYSPDNAAGVSPRPEYASILPFGNAVSYAERAPGRFILGFAPDPRRPDSIDRLSAAIEIHGVRTYGELKLRMMFDNLDAIRMYKFCGEKKLPVTVHIDYEFDSGSLYPRQNYWYGGGIEPFERAVRACPETIFLGHAPGFWAHISGDDKYNKEPYPQGKVLPGGKIIDMLRTYPNLYCDMSAGSGCNALRRDPEFAKDFLLEFQDRVLYARDYFDNIHQEFLNSLGLPEDVLAKIYAGNALKLVPIEGVKA
jgi:hypothetical protein